MNPALKIHHDLGDVILKPSGKVNTIRLKKMIRSALDQYLAEDRVPAKALHEETKRRHGRAYQTPGYYLRLYRQRAELTQVELAEQDRYSSAPSLRNGKQQTCTGESQCQEAGRQTEL